MCERTLNKNYATLWELKILTGEQSRGKLKKEIGPMGWAYVANGR
jgi:hypothetical protein